MQFLASCWPLFGNVDYDDWFFSRFGCIEPVPPIGVSGRCHSPILASCSCSLALFEDYLDLAGIFNSMHTKRQFFVFAVVMVFVPRSLLKYFISSGSFWTV